MMPDCAEGLPYCADEDSSVLPHAVIWADGQRFEVDRALDAHHAASLKVEGTRIRYTMRIGDETTCLLHERPRWFVEEKVRDEAAKR